MFKALALSISIIAAGTAGLYLRADPAWLASDECSFGDPDQCAAEAAAKRVLRENGGQLQVAK